MAQFWGVLSKNVLLLFYLRRTLEQKKGYRFNASWNWFLDSGSSHMWKKWLGEKAWIIGIDLNLSAKLLQKNGFEIYIGSQADANFWRGFYSKVGKIDVLVAGGGHWPFQQIMTIYCALCNLRCRSLIIVEDTATGFYNSVSKYHKKFFLEFLKDAVDTLTVREWKWGLKVGKVMSMKQFWKFLKMLIVSNSLVELFHTK